MPTAVKLLPNTCVVSCAKDGMVYLWSQPIGDMEVDTEKGPANGAGRKDGDVWSDDDSEDEIGSGTYDMRDSERKRKRMRFQPNILRLYNSDGYSGA